MKLPPCGDNPALKGISDAKTAINNQLTAGKSALASLNSKMNEFKGKVLAAVPKIPTLDSFQAELAGLIGASPAKIAAFLKKWEGKVEGLNELVAKVTGDINDILSLDFCKDVPNVKMDPVTKETKTEPPEPTPPTVAPVAPAPVTPTVVNKAKEPVKPAEAPTTPEIVTTYRERYTKPYSEQVITPLDAKRNPLIDERKALEKTDEWKRVNALADKKWSDPEQLLRSGQLAPAEASVVKRRAELIRQIFLLNQIASTCERFSVSCENALTDKALGVDSGQKILDSSGDISKLAKDEVKASAPGSDEYVEKVASLVVAQKDVVIEHRKYKRGIFA